MILKQLDPALSNSSSGQTNWKPFIFTVTLAVLIIIEPLYRQPLFDASIPLIISLQSSATKASIAFFKLVSNLGVGGIVGCTLLGSYLFGSRERTFYYITFFSLIMWLMSLVKMLYHSPRPYMVDDDVQVFGCSTEFGHPSGHSLNSMTFSLALLLDFLQSVPEPSGCSKAAAYIGAIVTPLLVGFSRLYNGVHTLDQIIYGLLLGLWLALLSHYCLRTPLIKHIKRLMTPGEKFSDKEINAFKTMQILLFIASIGSIVYTYQQISATFYVPIEWK